MDQTDIEKWILQIVIKIYIHEMLNHLSHIKMRRSIKVLEKEIGDWYIQNLSHCCVSSFKWYRCPGKAFVKELNHWGIQIKYNVRPCAIGTRL